MILDLRAHLAGDLADPIHRERKDRLVVEASQFGWWQRIALPGLKGFTTSRHDTLQISDPGFLNTLGNRLTAEEGFILRPMLKWAYLKPIFPNLEGKSVLEIESNNGFFCFEFEKLARLHQLAAFAWAGPQNP